jgi:hypothetical protein
MPRKNRSYKKEESFRDAKMFVVTCEGLREAAYFREFIGKSQRVKLITLEPKKTETDNIQRSSPKWVIDRAMKFIEAEGLFGKNEDDELWFVMDKDRWKDGILHQLSNDCKDKTNWFMALSNPCFEVWLFAHIQNPKELEITKCKDLKTLLNETIKGGYKVEQFVKMVDKAVENSKNNDSDFNTDFPKLMETKIYKLIQSIKSSL